MTREMRRGDIRRGCWRPGRCRRTVDCQDVQYYSSLIPIHQALDHHLFPTSAHSRNCFIGIERKCKCIVMASTPNNDLLKGFYLLEVIVDKKNGGNSIGSQFMVEHFFKVLKQTNNIAFNRLPYMLEKVCGESSHKKNSLKYLKYPNIESISKNDIITKQIKKDSSEILVAYNEPLLKSEPLKIHSERIPVMIKGENIKVLLESSDNEKKIKHTLLCEQIGLGTYNENINLNIPTFTLVLTSQLNEYVRNKVDIQQIDELEKEESLIYQDMTNDIEKVDEDKINRSLKSSIIYVRNSEKLEQNEQSIINNVTEFQEEELEIAKTRDRIKDNLIVNRIEILEKEIAKCDNELNDVYEYYKKIEKNLNSEEYDNSPFLNSLKISEINPTESIIQNNDLSNEISTEILTNIEKDNVKVIDLDVNKSEIQKIQTTERIFQNENNIYNKDSLINCEIHKSILNLSFENSNEIVEPVKMYVIPNAQNIPGNLINMRETSLISLLGEKKLFISDNNVDSKTLNEDILNLDNLLNEIVFGYYNSDRILSIIHEDNEPVTFSSENNIFENIENTKVDYLNNIDLEIVSEEIQKNENEFDKKEVHLTALSTLEYLKDNTELIINMSSESKESLAKEGIEEVKNVKPFSLNTINMLIDNVTENKEYLEECLSVTDNNISEETIVIPNIEMNQFADFQNIRHNDYIEEFDISSIISKPTKIANITLLPNVVNTVEDYASNTISILNKESYDNGIVSDINMEPFLNMLQNDLILYPIVPEDILLMTANAISETSDNQFLTKEENLEIEINLSTDENKGILKEIETKDIFIKKISDQNYECVNEKLKENKKINKMLNPRNSHKKLYKGNILDKVVSNSFKRCSDKKGEKHSNKTESKKGNRKSARDQLHFRDCKNTKFKTSNLKTKNDDVLFYVNQKSISKPLKRMSLLTKFGEEFDNFRKPNLIFTDKRKKEINKEDCNPPLTGTQYLNILQSNLCTIPLEKNIQTWVVYDTRPPNSQTPFIKELTIHEWETGYIMKEPALLKSEFSTEQDNILETITNGNNTNNSEIETINRKGSTNTFIKNFLYQSCNNKIDYEPLIFDYFKTGNNNYIKLDLLHSWESKTSSKKDRNDNKAIMEPRNHIEISLFESNQSTTAEIPSVAQPLLSLKTITSKNGPIQINCTDKKYVENDEEFFVSYNKSNHMLLTCEKKNKTNSDTNSDTSKIFDEPSIKTNDNIVQVIVYDDDCNSKELVSVKKSHLKKPIIRKHFKSKTNKNYKEVIVKCSSSTSSNEGVQINYESSATENKSEIRPLKGIRVRNKYSKKRINRSPFPKNIINFPNESWASCFDFVLKQIMLNSHFTP